MKFSELFISTHSHFITLQWLHATKEGALLHDGNQPPLQTSCAHGRSSRAEGAGESSGLGAGAPLR